MLGPPLQYQSLKTVLLHTDPNTRFRISVHLPSIRDLEKRVPLKIERLEMTEWRTVVNDTSYELAVVRYHPEEYDARQVEKQLGYDYDRLGFPLAFGDNNLLPGDVSFRTTRRFEDRRNTREDEERHRESLKVHEKTLEILTDVASKGITVNEYLASLDSISLTRLAHQYRRISKCIFLPLQELPFLIKKDKHNLIPFECRRNETNAPFKYYIELTVTKGENERIERFEYSKKLFGAVKHLHEVLFGGRSETIQVERFRLPSENDILRLPSDFRMQANKVNANDHTLSHRNFPMLVRNSDNLDFLWLRCRVYDLKSQPIRNAKRLILDGGYAILWDLSSLPNRKITIVRMFPQQWPELYCRYMQAWLAGNRPVGSSLWVTVEDDETILEALRSIETEFEKTSRTERSVTIHRENSTKVNIYYEPSEEPTQTEYEEIDQWTLKAKIVDF